MKPPHSLAARSGAALPRPAICDADQVHWPDPFLPSQPPPSVLLAILADYYEVPYLHILVNESLPLTRRGQSLYYDGCLNRDSLTIQASAWLNPLNGTWTLDLLISVSPYPIFHQHGLYLTLSQILPLTWQFDWYGGSPDWTHVAASLIM